MLYMVGRLMQIAGMIVLPLGMAGNLAHKLSESEMLQYLFVGGGLFIAGYLLQQAAGKK